MIRLNYGTNQRFRYRHSDINILGMTDVSLPVLRATYRLNGGPAIKFYVEALTTSNQVKYPYGARSPAINRLAGRSGHFNIEIPTDHSLLEAGRNEIYIEVEGSDGEKNSLQAVFDWDPRPVQLPLELNDLEEFEDTQDLGQAVNGEFETDFKKGTIYTKAPIGADSLFLVGSPHGSQEATYDVRFSFQDDTWSFIGLSDFFGGFEEQSPSLGIKPGYTTAGLATIDNKGYAKAWLSWGDCLIGNPNTWVVKTEKVVKAEIEQGVTFRVRHQAIMGDGVNVVRFRVWRKGTPEPAAWLCSENSLHLNGKYPSVKTASFGLFQYGGYPTTWSDIYVRPLDLKLVDLRLRKRRSDRVAQACGKANRFIRRVFDN